MLIYEDFTYKVRGVLYKVYNELGPGYLEKIYQRAVLEELNSQKIPHEIERKVQIKYQNKIIGWNKLDLVVFEKILVELKAVNSLEKFHQSQVLAYLKSSGLRLGLLVNFGSEKLEIKRIVN